MYICRRKGHWPALDLSHLYSLACSSKLLNLHILVCLPDSCHSFLSGIIRLDLGDQHKRFDLFLQLASSRPHLTFPHYGRTCYYWNFFQNLHLPSRGQQIERDSATLQRLNTLVFCVLQAPLDLFYSVLFSTLCLCAPFIVTGLRQSTILITFRFPHKCIFVYFLAETTLRMFWLLAYIKYAF